jgi:hypothetical protein
MKSILLVLSSVMVSMVAVAQIPAGTKLFGGHAGVFYSKSEQPFNNVTNVSFNISPRIAKATKDNVVRGIE